MKRLRLSDLYCGSEGHILRNVIPGKYLSQGGIGFKKPGDRSHDAGCDCPSCDGAGRHVHADDSEVFIVLQGKARMEVDGIMHDMVSGDVIVCEPGEDHHLIADQEEPCVNLFFHASDLPHENQRHHS